MFEALASAASGSVLGAVAVHFSGMTAIGIVGGGAGFGAAAGPVGAAAGAVAGLAVYGVICAFGG